jgi:hypothetical protein
MPNQNCSFAPSSGSAATVYVTSFGPGDTSWTCTATGYYVFTARGSGGPASSGATTASGAAAQKTVHLYRGQVVTFAIGGGGAGVNTVVTFPSGEVMTATAGTVTGTPPPATGGDLNVSGIVSAIGFAADAPTIGNFTGGKATTAGSTAGSAVGASGGANGGGGPSSLGGPGALYLQSGKAPRIL